ncbi:hypothetical protein EDB83DRAFT_2640185 [Lactarius deliciosus]|nr:hypothetical protein EDB83DRAFT_2640185 [Lactarius deliciosus]
MGNIQIEGNYRPPPPSSSSTRRGAVRIERAATTRAIGLHDRVFPCSLPTPYRGCVLVVARAARLACIGPAAVVAVVAGGCGSTSGSDGFGSGIADGGCGTHVGLYKGGDVVALGPVMSTKDEEVWWLRGNSMIYNLRQQVSTLSTSLPIADDLDAQLSPWVTDMRLPAHIHKQPPQHRTAPTPHPPSAMPLPNPSLPDVDPQPPATTATTAAGPMQANRAARNGGRRGHEARLREWWRHALFAQRPDESTTMTVAEACNYPQFVYYP